MIFFLGFPIMFVYSLKGFFFFNSYVFISDFYILLSSISFMVFSLLCFFKFFFLENISYKMYYLSFVFIILFMNMCFFCDNFFIFILLFELSVMPMILLIFNFSFGFDKLVSGIFMFVMNTLGSFPFMISLSHLFDLFGSFSFILSLMTVNLDVDSLFIFMFLMMIFFFKLPLFFFHFWLPKAHVGGSGPCSMVLASLMLKLGSMSIFKFSFYFIFCFISLYPFFSSLVFLLFVLVSLSLIRFVDLKVLIAFSSVLHMSPVPFIFFNMSFLGVMSGFMFMVGHGLISTVLFFLLTLMYEQSFMRSFIFFKGIDKINKIFFFFFLFYILINFGFPPFISFFSEFLMLCCCYFNSMILLLGFFFYSIFCNVIFMMFVSKMALYKINSFVFFDFNLNFILMMFLIILSIIFTPWMI